MVGVLPALSVEFGLLGLVSGLAEGRRYLGDAPFTPGAYLYVRAYVFTIEFGVTGAEFTGLDGRRHTEAFYRSGLGFDFDF
jgi:hypothetical protein